MAVKHGFALVETIGDTALNQSDLTLWLESVTEINRVIRCFRQGWHHIHERVETSPFDFRDSTHRLQAFQLMLQCSKKRIAWLEKKPDWTCLGRYNGGLAQPRWAWMFECSHGFLPPIILVNVA
jgi:hypothetical protein